jgi:predicted MFS family arabinose efflux permease
MSDIPNIQIRKRILSLSIAMGVNTFAYSIIYPFLPIYLHTVRKFPMTKVAWVFPVMGLATIIGAPLSGFVADRIGRRILLIFGPIGRSSCFFILAFLAGINGPFYAIVIMLFLTTLTGMFFRCSVNAYVTDIVPVQNRTPAFGKMRIGLNIGWMTGPAIGAFLARTPFSLLFGLTALFCLAPAVIAFKFCPAVQLKKDKGYLDSKRNLTVLHAAFNDLKTLAILGFSFLLFLSVSQFASTLSIFSTKIVGISKTSLGFLYTINGAIVIILQVPIDKYLRQLNIFARASAGSLFYPIVFIIFAFSKAWMHFAFGIVILTIGEILVMTALVSAVSRRAPSDMVGRYMGIYGMVQGLGWAIGPFFGLILFEYFSHQPLILWGILSSGGVIAFFGFFGLAVTDRKQKTEDERQITDNSK